MVLGTVEWGCRVIKKKKSIHKWLLGGVVLHHPLHPPSSVFTSNHAIVPNTHSGISLPLYLYLEYRLLAWLHNLEILLIQVWKIDYCLLLSLDCSSMEMTNWWPKLKCFLSPHHAPVRWGRSRWARSTYHQSQSFTPKWPLRKMMWMHVNNSICIFNIYLFFILKKSIHIFQSSLILFSFSFFFKVSFRAGGSVVAP